MRSGWGLSVKAVGVAAVVACGVVVGAAGGVGAAPSSFADRSVSKVTDDGWRVTAVKAQEKIRSVAPLNQSSWTREGFLSLKGQAKITGQGRVAIDAGTVSSGFQIGCNTDVSSGITMGVMGGPTAQMSISYPPAVILGAQILPNVSATLKPGTISTIPFGTKKLAGSNCRSHPRWRACESRRLPRTGISLRAFVTVAISTKANDNTVNVYGKPHYL